jgi:uncharacterized protein
VESRPCLIVFARAAIAGQAKERLARAVGAQRANELYSAFLADTLDTCRSIDGVDLEVWFTPASAQAQFRALAPHALLTAQAEGDLGARMHRAFEAASARGAGGNRRRVVIIGSDTPHLARERVEEAFASLRTHPLVLGPSADGGYYLIGLTRPRAELFADIAWGTERVLAATLERARELGLAPELLPEEFDLDTAEDLERLRKLLRSGRATCPRTAAALET